MSQGSGPGVLLGVKQLVPHWGLGDEEGLGGDIYSGDEQQPRDSEGHEQSGQLPRVQWAQISLTQVSALITISGTV